MMSDIPNQNTLQKLIGSILGRFIDKGNPTSGTNISTAFGASLMALGTSLVQMGDQTSQGLGFAIGLIGFGITLYKSK